MAIQSSIPVVVSAPPSGVDFPNIPTGGNAWTLISDVTFDSAGDLITTTSYNANRWRLDGSVGMANRFSIVDATTVAGLGTAPFGNNVMRCSYTPCTKGSAPFNIRQTFSGASETTLYREIYWVIWWAYHPNFYDGNGASSVFKFGFLKGANQTNNANHWWGRGGHNDSSKHRVAVQTANPGSVDYNFTKASPHGVFHKWEQHIIACDVGQVNGRWRVWIDDILAKDQNPASTTPATGTAGFRAMTYNPTYSQIDAGTTDIPSNDPSMFTYVARWATFGRN